MHKNHYGENGKVAESDFFGNIDKGKHWEKLNQKVGQLKSNPEKRKELQAVVEKLRNVLPPYDSRRSSFAMIEECQAFPPNEPDKEYARELRGKVLALLQEQSEVADEIQDTDVLFFTACSDLVVQNKTLDTSLDRWHGIDAFMKVRVGDRWVLITMDGSIDPNKMEKKPKTDVVTIWPEDLDSRENPETFNSFVEMEAQKVFDSLQSKIRE